MTRSQGRIDLAKFRAHFQDQDNKALQSPSRTEIVTRAKIRLIENQLKEARVGEHTILCDESTANKGGGKAPSPLQYFIAAVGF